MAGFSKFTADDVATPDEDLETGLVEGGEVTLEARVTSVRVHKPETGWAVLHVTDRNRRTHVLAGVLHLADDIRIGDSIEALGTWDDNPRFGRQFRARSIVQMLDRDGINLSGAVRWIGNNVPGVGKMTAQRLKEAFGQRLVSVLGDALSLATVIPFEKAEAIAEAWENAHDNGRQRGLLWLLGLGVGPRTAEKIAMRYGERVRDVVTRDPWSLARTVSGIGFTLADRIGRAAGAPLDSPSRIDAGLAHALHQASVNGGHCGLPPRDLVKEATRLLEVPAALVMERLKAMLVEGLLVRLREPEGQEGTATPPILVTTPGMARDLDAIIDGIRTALGVQAVPDAVIKAAMERVHGAAQKAGFQLAEAQEEGIRSAVQNRIAVVTGGPGVGKTTVLKYVHVACQGQRVLDTSFTGKAAKRMSEATGLAALTIHRALKWTGERYWSDMLGHHVSGSEARAMEEEGCEDLQLRGVSPGFLHDEHRPLRVDRVIVDESSMPDVPLMAALFRAINFERTGVLLVGDKDQLPPVGAGRFFTDVIASGVIPVTRLTAVFRQAAGGAIATAVSTINEGRVPDAGLEGGEYDFLEAKTDVDIRERIVRQLSRMVWAEEERLGAKARIQGLVRVNLDDSDSAIDAGIERLIDEGYDMRRDVLILAPMRRGPAGVYALNAAIKDAVNPLDDGEPSVRLPTGQDDVELRASVGDKVLQRRNDYGRGVMNGEIGFVVGIDPVEKEVVVDYGGHEPVSYSMDDFKDSVEMAWAQTIHKAQGSEAKICYVVMSSSAARMLNRPLAYTGESRGKMLAHFVGQREALAKAVATEDAALRFSNLAPSLRRAAAEAALEREARAAAELAEDEPEDPAAVRMAPAPAARTAAPLDPVKAAWEAQVQAAEDRMARLRDRLPEQMAAAGITEPADDPRWEELNQRLRRHNWSYDAMDGAPWREGLSNEREIMRLQGDLGPDLAYIAWLRHVPATVHATQAERPVPEWADDESPFAIMSAGIP